MQWLSKTRTVCFTEGLESFVNLVSSLSGELVKRTFAIEGSSKYLLSLIKFN